MEGQQAPGSPGNRIPSVPLSPPLDSGHAGSCERREDFPSPVLLLWESNLNDIWQINRRKIVKFSNICPYRGSIRTQGSRTAPDS